MTNYLNSKEQDVWLITWQNDDYALLIRDDSIEYYCSVRREWTYKVEEFEALFHDLQDLGVKAPKWQTLLMSKYSKGTFTLVVWLKRQENNRILAHYSRYQMLQLVEEVTFVQGHGLIHCEILNVVNHSRYNSDYYMSNENE